MTTSRKHDLIKVTSHNSSKKNLGKNFFVHRHSDKKISKKISKAKSLDQEEYRLTTHFFSSSLLLSTNNDTRRRKRINIP
jgi:hypothetical protein